MKSLVVPTAILLAASAWAARAEDAITLVPHNRIDHAAFGIFPPSMGGVEIQAGLAAPILLVPEMADTTGGRWQAPSSTSPLTLSESGGAVTGSATFKWGSGAPVEFQMSAKPSGRRVDLAATWKVDGEAAGHFRFDIRIPATLAGDISVRAGDKEIFAGGEVRPGLGRGPLVFSRSSDGEELFRVEGDFFAGGFVEKDRFDRFGLSVRLSPHKMSGATALGEFSEFELKFVFP